MTDQDRVPYSYDDIFPERFLHAPDLDGRTVTLTIADIWGEYIQNPKQKRKKERGDLCGVLAFRGTKREYAMSKQNAWIIKTLWGKDPENIRGKRITLSPVPDSSGFTEHNTRILFVGSPDIEHDLALTLPGGQALTFRKTPAKGGTITEGSVVDAVTGEVAADDPATSTEPAESSAPASFASTEPSEPFSAEIEESDGGEELDLALGNVSPIREPAITAAQLKAIKGLVKDLGVYEVELVSILDSYSAQTIEGLTKKNAEFVLAALKERQP